MSLNVVSKKVNLKNFAELVFGKTENGCCIECKQPALEKCHTEAGKREFRISGICEECFDVMFKEIE